MQNASSHVLRPLHDTVLKRYRVAAGSARPLRDYLPLRDFSIIHDYRLPRDPSYSGTPKSPQLSGCQAWQHRTQGFILTQTPLIDECGLAHFNRLHFAIGFQLSQHSEHELRIT